MSTDELIDSVMHWGYEHGINNPDKQILKVIEEVSEIAREIVRGRYDTPEIIDGIGDSLVTLIILANILGFDPRECLQTAYDTIKDREGTTKDGCFVKSTD